MQKIIDLWAIIWPIIKTIFGMLGVWDVLAVFLIYGVSHLILGAVIRELLPRKRRGGIFSEALHLFVDVFVTLLPLITAYHWIKEKVPLASELASFIITFTEIDILITTILKIFLVCMVAFAIARFTINVVSVLLQKFVIELPYISEVLLALIRVAESMIFVLTVLWLPFFAMSLFKRVDPYPVIIYDAIMRPPEANEEVWGYIEEGIHNAHQNGVECDPYLLYSLKVYETGSNICTPIYQFLPRPNECASYAGALGMWQFLPETFSRNAGRYDVKGTLWEPNVAAEVACYFINDEVRISLAQTREHFIREFAIDGLIWNRDPSGAGIVYDRALALRKSAQDNYEPPEVSPGEYIWPAPKEAFVWYEWGVPMWYGHSHNGIDIAMSGLPVFKVYAMSDGKARYWDGGSCNAGVITLKTSKGDEFHYVHMEWDTSKIYIPADGEWYSVKQGQSLGWILNGNTTCSIGNHLHLMFTDGRYISGDMFKK